MKQFRAGLAVLAISSSLSAAPPTTTLFCTTLKKAISASHERPAFKSLYGKVIDSYDRQASLALPGFSNCLISGYSYRRPSYDCAFVAATPQKAQALLLQTRKQIEQCLGGSMYEDHDRSTHPWVLRKGQAEYPFTFVNVLNDKEVVVGHASDFVPDP